VHFLGDGGDTGMFSGYSSCGMIDSLGPESAGDVRSAGVYRRGWRTVSRKDRYVAKGLILLALTIVCLIGAQPAFAAPILHMPTDIVNAPPKDDSNLPSESGVSLRSPGMQLPTGSESNKVEALANPFAPVKKEAPKTPEQVESQIRSQAFTAALTGLLPLKTNEIRKLLETFDETRQAVETPIYPDPEPEVIAQTISLDPGAAPPEIKVAVGHVTTVSMLDVTGEAWPIQDMTWAGAFDITSPETGGNVFRIAPQSEFAHGNISIRMNKLKAPLTFVLRTHRDKVYYRFDVRIPDYGPFAQQPLIEGGGPTLAAGDSVQNAILDGVPPAGAVKLAVTGVDNRTTAYKISNATYVRTPLTLLSPGWSSSVSSADGTSVYMLADSPVVLLSDQGNIVQAHLSDRDTGKDVTTAPPPSSPTGPASAAATPAKGAK
jgi:intracellular multiplication protein IcmK